MLRSESSEKVTLWCIVRLWVHVASTAVESFLFLPMNLPALGCHELGCGSVAASI